MVVGLCFAVRGFVQRLRSWILFTISVRAPSRIHTRISHPVLAALLSPESVSRTEFDTVLNGYERLLCGQAGANRNFDDRGIRQLGPRLDEQESRSVGMTLHGSLHYEINCHWILEAGHDTGNYTHSLGELENHISPDFRRGKKSA